MANEVFPYRQMLFTESQVPLMLGLADLFFGENTPARDKLMFRLAVGAKGAISVPILGLAGRSTHFLPSRLSVLRLEQKDITRYCQAPRLLTIPSIACTILQGIAAPGFALGVGGIRVESLEDPDPEKRITAIWGNQALMAKIGEMIPRI
jgi:hypothetical protein